MALRLAAPHTWAASILLALLGAALAAADGYACSTFLLISLAAVCVFMQAAVNTFNDYSDFIKGTDTVENSPDAADAVMVYARPAPWRVLMLGFCFLLAAALSGIPAIIQAGIKPLAIGAIGALAVLAYSFGKKPLSYLPLGELVSGFVMGGLIPMAVYGVISLNFTGLILLRALPMMLGIALIMMTNNACDIQRDSASGRQTFAVVLGQKRTAALYRISLCVWLLLPEMLLVFTKGAAIYPLAVLPVAAFFSSQLRLELSPQRRGQAMAGISTLNIMLGFAYIAAICLGSSI